jgi:hypothetical protein
MLRCKVCGSKDAKNESVSEVIVIDGKPVLVENIPAPSIEAKRLSVEKRPSAFAAWCMVKLNLLERSQWMFLRTNHKLILRTT